MRSTELINCPLCNSDKHKHWGEENGFVAVRCANCLLVYVNPRPMLSMIDAAVRTGTHSEEANSINVVTHRTPAKVSQYEAILKQVFRDVWARNQKISWLDVGAGFGEVVEAVKNIAQAGSDIQGLEPMEPKARVARSNGLVIQEKYLSNVDGKFDFISTINVFSHVPDFHQFLQDAKSALTPEGELFIETGNTADMERKDVPGELSLPDHLVFAGESQMLRFLDINGFKVIGVTYVRVDSVFEFLKNIVKLLLRRPTVFWWPYSSPYRSLLIRAKLKN
jgi:SAM-dependent methyltransferase